MPATAIAPNAIRGSDHVSGRWRLDCRRSRRHGPRGTGQYGAMAERPTGRPPSRVRRAATVCLTLVAAVLVACQAGPAAAPGDPSPAATAPTTATRPVVRTFTIAATGDLLIHMPVAAVAKAYGAGSGLAYDFRPMFDLVRPTLSAADLAICHQETPLSRDDTDLSGYPTFNAPRELASAAADAGFDRCSTASNHAFDQSAGGVVDTIDALEAAGLGWAGTARTAEEAARPKVDHVEGVAVAYLSYAYGLNGLTLPADGPWLVNLIDPDRILADAAAARAAGAQFVVVSLQWGNEYQSAPTPEQVDLAHLLLASPAIDLIVGHHVHVVQPVERVGDKYVLYGLGNFLSNQTPNCCPAASQDGVIAVVTISDEGGRLHAISVTYVPTWVEPRTYRILVVADALADPALARERQTQLAASFTRTATAISALAAPGLVPAGSVPGG